MTDLPPELLPVQEQIIEQRLIECGLNPFGFTVNYEDYLQSIEIVIAPNSGATSENFACIHEAAGHEIVTFEAATMLAAYTDFVAELVRPEMMAMLEAQLIEAGLWEGFPASQDFGSLEDYARALEVHASVKPGSALRVSGEGIFIDPPRDSPDYSDFAECYSKLLLVFTYASTKERVRFGFIGNKRFAD
jgi:hypothetical protein